MIAGAAALNQQFAGAAAIIDEQLAGVGALGAVGGSAGAGGAGVVTAGRNVGIGLIVAVDGHALEVDQLPERATVAGLAAGVAVTGQAVRLARLAGAGGLIIVLTVTSATTVANVLGRVVEKEWALAV